MSRQIGLTTEILLRRIRQEGGLALSPDFATKVYSLCEQAINTALRRVLTTTTLSIPKQKLLFSLRDELSSAVDIISITQSNRDIPSVSSIDEISAFDPTWFRSITGTRFEAWHQIGRDLLILYPGQTAISSVDITYVKLLTLRDNFLTAYNENSELPDEDVDIALSLAELILLTRFRLLSNISKKLEQVVTLLKLRGVKI